jgi:enoyl-CoA hydratase
VPAESLNDSAESFGDDLKVIRDGSIATVWMDRPQKLNAMRRNFWPDLRAVFDALESDPAIRAVVITGAGDKAFSAGGDIASFRELGSLTAKRNFQLDAMKTFARVENSPLPVIAAVNGYALGGGCELTLACDIVIASERARFGMPEAALGLVPGYGILRAPDVIGRQMTKLMIFAKLQLDAARALQVGMVQEVVAPDALMPRALALAAEVAASSPIALEVGKKVVNRGTSFAEFDYATEALTVLQATDDTEEGTRAFLERRKPQFGARF